MNVSLIKNDSYSFGKGAAGVLAFGAVGAVAGIGGKTQIKYHCSACGSDNTTVMSPNMEMHVQSVIASGDNGLYELLKMDYPNIEPIHEINIMDSSSSSVTGGLPKMILDYLEKANRAISEKDVMEKFDSYRTLEVRDAIDEIQKQGRVKLANVGKDKFFELAKNPEDIQRFALMYDAKIIRRDRREVFGKVRDIIITLIRVNPGISENQIVGALREILPELEKPNNPYSFSIPVEECLNWGINYETGLITEKDETYWPVSSVKIESAKRNVATILEKDCNENLYKEEYMTALVSILKNHNGEKVTLAQISREINDSHILNDPIYIENDYEEFIFEQMLLLERKGQLENLIEDDNSFWIWKG